MNKFKKIFLVIIAGLALLLSVLLAQPSDATGAKYQTLIDRGLVNGVRTPQELGLAYLQQEAVQLIADNSILNSIYLAEERVAILPEDIPLRFDLGTNYPIRTRQLQDGGELTTKTGYDAVGYVDRSGNTKSFNAPILRAMFAVEARNGGNLAMTPKAQHILVADASRRFWQASRIPTIDLIVHSKQANQLFVLRNANANAVCRDAVNSVLNRTLQQNRV
ncbi:MAG: hypothetical protein EA000_13175 [Oscillatoriales cyanobacterium]|uniref:hypothetical protein n=1 Tax=Microcoleus anatoxicus TaxID=2705319 RepID=UPI002985D503|nr:MAG: hypothetical protein EA000_13175 [Oscillatoriales cyanobacterium]